MQQPPSLPRPTGECRGRECGNQQPSHVIGFCLHVVHAAPACWMPPAMHRPPTLPRENIRDRHGPLRGRAARSWWWPAGTFPPAWPGEAMGRHVPSPRRLPCTGRSRQCAEAGLGLRPLLRHGREQRLARRAAAHGSAAKTPARGMVAHTPSQPPASSRLLSFSAPARLRFRCRPTGQTTISAP